MAAAWILFTLFCDGEIGSEVYTAASEAKQAAIAFGIVKDMIRNDSELLAAAELYHNHLLVGTAVYRPLTSEVGSKDGLNAHLVHTDELHAHKTPDLVDVLTTSQGSRSQPMVLHTTTADFNRPNSVCNQLHDYADKVRDGIIDDPAFLPIVYAATIDDDWTDPEVWARVNPNLGVSVLPEYLERKFKRAENEPSFENTFKRRHLCIRTEQQTRFLPMDDWDKCDGELPDLSNRECWGAVDLASTKDITAMCLVFPEGNGYIVKPFFWIPADTARERGRVDKVPYPQWIREGLITATDGKQCDYNVVRHDINELALQYEIREVAFDPWNAMGLINDLQEHDGWGDRVIKMPQTAKLLSSPMKDLEGLVANHELCHGGNPVLRWMASNIVAKHDTYENLTPDKEHSSDKIDGIVAMVMAIGRASINASGASVYDDPENRQVFL